MEEFDLEDLPLPQRREAIVWRSGHNRGVAEERERIIALLKSALISAEDANYLIELIKGEN